jgi:LmbE family N-acetylglucosaminyl deacetylase
MEMTRLASHYLDNLPEVDVAIMMPHPGEAELLCGGTIAKLSSAGKRVAILDLTAGEAGTLAGGNRILDEGDVAAGILGVAWRGTMRFPDGRLEDTIMSRMTVTGEFKRLRPQVVVAMHPEDRHPDSLAASLLVENASYLAGLSGLDNYLSAHATGRVVFASGSVAASPAFVVDVSPFFEQKMAALKAYTTLFADPAEVLARVEREARRFGEMIGVRYGEPFTQRQPLAGDLL